MRINRPELACWLLIFALIFNAIFHFTHPAYNYYKTNFESVRSLLKSDYIKYCDLVKTNTIEAVNLFISNFGVDYKQNLTTSKTRGDEKKILDTPILPEVDKVQYHLFIDSGKPYIILARQNYTVGDTYPRGGVITAITADSIILDGRYRVTNALSPEFERITRNERAIDN